MTKQSAKTSWKTSRNALCSGLRIRCSAYKVPHTSLTTNLVSSRIIFQAIADNEFEMTSKRPDIRNVLEERILIIDGSMGALIMSNNPDEAGYRGERFRNHSVDLRNSTDLLVLTQPKLITGIHQQYIDAGADIIETDTFNANIVSLEEFQLAHLTYEINKTGSELARAVADKATARNPNKPRYVAGSIGPTKIQLSLNADKPGTRPFQFDAMVESYAEQIRGLMDGG